MPIEDFHDLIGDTLRREPKQQQKIQAKRQFNKSKALSKIISNYF